MFKIIKKISVFVCLLIVAMTLTHFALAANGVVDVGMNNIDGTSIGETTGLGQQDPRIIVANIVRITFGFLGIIAVGLIIYAGWLYMTAGGEEDKVEKAKKILIGAVIGIIICLASFAIASFVLNKLLEATGASNNTAGGGAGGGIVVDGGRPSLPVEGEPCVRDILDITCAAGSCATGLSCSSSTCLCIKTNKPGEGQNCDGDTSLAGCQATDCSNNLVCSADDNCTCVRTPLISWISPLDASSTPNGAPGNFITIGGQYFGTSTGQVIFLGDISTSTDDKIATFPNSVNAQCTDFWQDNQIIAVVPVGAVSGPIKVIDSKNLWDITDNSRGPAINNFKIHNIKRPGLCKVSPASGSFGDQVILYGNLSWGSNRRAFFGNKISAIQAGQASWPRILIPNIQDGRTSVFAIVMSGATDSAGITLPPEDSNSLGFTVKNNIQNNPIINNLDPVEGPKGQYVTIYGSNFKNFKLGTSAVKFYLPADSNAKINADVDFPKQCQSKYWNDTYITVKVPQVVTIGDYKIIVINSDNSSSTPANFKITTGAPSPGLCLLDPYNGPIGQPIQAYGEYFGSSQGTNGRAVFYNNINSSPSSWADQAIKVNVPSGSQTGPFKIINNNQKISNALPFKVGACVKSTDCLDSNIEECCPSGTYNAGLCKTKGECSMGGARSCVFNWNFSTAPNVNIFTCSGYNTVNACLETDMCPNSPGKCQTAKTNIATGDCNNIECNKTASCNGQCVYDQILNKCKLAGVACDTASSTIITGFNAECRNVGLKNIWQINTKGASCPGETYLEANGWCSVGVLGSPTECGLCSLGFVCQEKQCVIPSSGCPADSTCDTSGKCVKNKETCECCCRVANSAQDCCAGLTCKAGGCGAGAPNYGVCTGCKVVISGQVDKTLSDKSCNCSGKSTRYCDLDDQTNYPLGRCADQKIAGEYCYNDFSGGTCNMASSTCASGFECDSENCKCKVKNNNPVVEESCSGRALNQCNNSYFCPNSPGKCSSYGGNASSTPSCDCCCSIADNDATTGKNPGCCAPLTCEGRCGSSIGTTTLAIFGSCSGCAKTGSTQAEHNSACNCSGTSGKFCLINTANPNGVCKDCAQIASSTDCSILGASTCCVDAQDKNVCRGGAGNNNIISNDSPDLAYCSYYSCNIASSTCGSVAVASSTLPSYRTLEKCSEKCIDLEGPLFGRNCANQAISTSTCSLDLCKNFSCLNSDGSSPSWSAGSSASSTCGTCCCNPFATTDQCKTINSKLTCLKNKGNCSGNSRGLCCGCKSDDECGSAGSTGCGTDTCCYTRPRATPIIPTNNQIGVCRNAVIEANFDQIMDITSFNNNIFLIGDYEDKACPAGTKFLGENISRRNNNIFSRVFKKVLISLEKILKPIFGKNVFAIDHNYCLINGTIGGRRDVASTTIATFTLQKALDANLKYYVVIKGDSTATSATTTNSIERGVLNSLGIGMKGNDAQTFNAKTFSNSKIWSFITSKDICQLDNVIIDPVSYLFQTSENNPADDDSASLNYDTINDSDKVYHAKAMAINGQEILPFNGVYSWSWSWNIDNNEIVNFKNLTNTNTNQQTLVAQNKQDAKTVVNAKAIITDDTVIKPSTVNQFKVGKADVYVLMCANPWPPMTDNNTWQPWRDSLNNCSAGLAGTGCSNNNFEFYYCRDVGQKGTADDLPAILKDTVVRGFSSDLNILKEYYFLREDLPSITVLSVNNQHSGGRVVANWNSVANASGYKLYYGKTKGQYDNFVDVGNATSRIVTGLTNEQTYYFVVSAYYKSTGAESAYSNEESITPTDTTVPSVPTNLRVVVANQKITLTWAKASDDTTYYLAYYGTASRVYGNDPVKINIADSCSATGECSLTFENLVNNTVYYFAIKAFDSYNNGSEFSSEKSATLQ